uniref:RNase H type-1 domain-containing protein n=1 Tax=Davidia involucrata TaxID=16924 RepID=A0A5B7BAX6_DAVIN
MAVDAMCKTQQETVLHLFGDCVFARQVWYLSILQVDSITHVGDSFISWWQSIMDGWKTLQNCAELQRLASFIIWFIWKARNEKIFNDETACPLRTMHLAQRTASEFGATLDLNQSSATLTPFPAYFFCCCFSGVATHCFSFSETQCSWGLEKEGARWGYWAVIRNQNGDFLAGLAKKVMRIGSAQSMEAVALVEGILKLVFVKDLVLSLQLALVFPLRLMSCCKIFLF